ncbi:MAG: hypothetical protein CSA33_07045 [Desulfobulbus propionicus]|nr:MAG: hypothetical protein CSA33_07045 [Desulfobulbus propionicus]
MLADEPNTLILEGGNVFFHPAPIPGQDTTALLPDRSIIAEEYLHKLNVVCAIGSGDVTFGLSPLKTLLRKHPFTALSANLTDGKATLLFSPSTTLQLQGSTIGILALTDHTLIRPRQNLSVIPWDRVLDQEINKLRTQVDFIVLLSNYPFEENRRIAQRFTDIRLILQSGHRTTNRAPQQVHNALICQTEKRGTYLGALKLSLAGNGFWEKRQTKEYRQLERQLNQVARSLARLQNYAPLSEEDQRTKDRLETTQDRLKKQKAAFLREGYRGQGEGDLYMYKFLPLHKSLPVEPEVTLHIKEAIAKREQLRKQ